MRDSPASNDRPTRSAAFKADCLEGQTVLITGGCGALGKVIVPALRTHGAVVAVNDVLPSDEARTFVPIQAGVDYFPADITRAAEVEGLFRCVEDRLGIVTAVLCHAGRTAVGPIREQSEAEWDRVMDLNLKAAFLTAREAVRRMEAWSSKERPGRIIFTSSWVQDYPWPDIAIYNASKAGLKMLMRSVAREVADRHILVNSVAPGIVAAGMAKRQWDTEPSFRARASRAIPLGYLQPPETVADAFVFLCSGASCYMTGTTLLVDGGCSLYPMD